MHDDRLRNRARRLRQSSTVDERTVWQLLRGNKLNGLGFRRQSPVADYVVDFLCHALKLVVEIDGPVHEEAEQAAFDKRRDAEMSALGFTVLRLDEAFVRRFPYEALARIKDAAAELQRNLGQ